ncbi:MAG: NAD(P)-dependent oxidoreductase [Chloroflexota bacterium]
MRILVTGGLGTVGHILVDQLRQKNHEVWLCDLPHHHDPHYFRCDVSRYRQLRQILTSQKFDLVYHLAAEFGRWNGEDYYETLWLSNAVGTKNIIRLQEELGFRLVFFSSSEVYGDWNGVMSEDVMDKHEVRQLNDYAITKWVSEMQIMNSADQFGTESVRIRFFNTYGPGEYYSPYRSVVCRFIYSAIHNLPYTVYLDHHRTSTYVVDTARTIANIADNFKAGEVYNIAGTEYHDIKELSDTILDYLGMDDSLVEYKEAEPFTTKDKKVDAAKAIRDLDHRLTIPLSEGIPKTIDWMKAVYSGQSGDYRRPPQSQVTL